jgi:hypothetical protein
MAQNKKSLQDRFKSWVDEINATGDPGVDNERVMKFLAEEAKSPVPWWKKSSWGAPPMKNQTLFDEIILLKAHYEETRNPLFALLAYRWGQMLSSEYSQKTYWVDEYMKDAIGNLLAFVKKLPMGRPREAVAQALGFSAKQNGNPFREAQKIVEEDNIYITVRRLQEGIIDGKRWGIVKALKEIAKERGITYPRARKIYYDMRKLVEQERDTNAAQVADRLVIH